MPLKLVAAITGLACLLAIGCRGDAPRPVIDIGSASLTVAEAQLLERASAARDSYASKLKAALAAEIASGNPARAIHVCAEVAPVMAAEVGKVHGLRIGRTSFKRRNPENQPPLWAKPAVDEKVAAPSMVRHDEELGFLFPIRLQAECLLCHGDTKAIPPDVLAAIAARYPHDKATGFKEGELRGWFWVEIDFESLEDHIPAG